MDFRFPCHSVPLADTVPLGPIGAYRPTGRVMDFSISFPFPCHSVPLADTGPLGLTGPRAGLEGGVAGLSGGLGMVGIGRVSRHRMPRLSGGGLDLACVPTDVGSDGIYGREVYPGLGMGECQGEPVRGSVRAPWCSLMNPKTG